MMRRFRRTLLVLVSPWRSLVVVLVRSCVVVDETEYVLVTEFGRVVAVYGDGPGEAGLHSKWPWQSSLAIDRRLRVFDPPPREMITGDKRNLEVAGYVVWRVERPGAVPPVGRDARRGRGAAQRAGLRGLEQRRSAAATWPRWRRPTRKRLAARRADRRGARGRRAAGRARSWGSRWSTSGSGGSTTRSRSARPSST